MRVNELGGFLINSIKHGSVFSQSNKYMAKLLSSVLFILGAAYLGLATSLSFIEGRLSSTLPINQYLIGISLLCLIIAFRTRDFFYDDRYEIFTIRNPRILLPMLERQAKANLELPKRQIMDYRVLDYWIYKKLTIYFASHKGELKIKHFYIYALPTNTWRAILANLDLLVETNNPKESKS